jgi:uncharacterized membrane protein YkoI
MKKPIGILTLFVSVTLLSCAQDTPAKVAESFKTKFPTAKSVKWEKENEKEWEAEFKMEGKEYSANFSVDGTWLETEHEIKNNELPEAVKMALKNDFGVYEIEEIEISEKSNGTAYEVELEKGEQTLEVVFDVSGKVLSKKEVIESEEE